jgi:hypothetical protein
MQSFLFIDAVLLGLAVIATFLLLRAGAKARRRAEVDAATTLAEAGLECAGDLLGTFVARSRRGAEVLLTNRTTTHARPGTAAPSGDACVAAFEVSLVDQIVCRSADADTVMGPLPAVPRMHTGYAPFDQAYAVFVGASGGASPGGSYRSAPVASDIPWTQPALLDRLMELGLSWLRVHEGRAEIVFPPLEAEDMGRAAALAAAVEQVARGGPIPALVQGPRSFRQRVPVPPTAWVVVAWAACIFTGPMGSMVLGFSLGSYGVGAELACGAGGIIGSSRGSGGSHTICYAGQAPQLNLYFFACGLLVVAITVLIAAGISAKLLMDSRRELAGG